MRGRGACHRVGALAPAGRAAHLPGQPPRPAGAAEGASMDGEADPRRITIHRAEDFEGMRA
ncbi:MAG: hypothetical protein ACREE5_10250, partial [Acetobacteraceae bacterium]